MLQDLLNIMTSAKTLVKDTPSGRFWSTTLSTRFYAMSYPEVAGVLKIVQGYILTEAMIILCRAQKLSQNHDPRVRSCGSD